MRIERVQNESLWAAYKHQRDYLLNFKYEASQLRVNSACPGTSPTLERRLWHGAFYYTIAEIGLSDIPKVFHK